MKIIKKQPSISYGAGIICEKLPLIIFVITILHLQGCAEDLTPRSLSKDKGSENLPILVGLETKAEKPITIEVSVQAAYNADMLFFNVSWQGNRGDSHDYLHFNNGIWKKQGSHRRDAQSTIDRDVLRGPLDVAFTSSESSVSFIIDDPDGNNAVPGFAKFGCFLACHDDAQHMPEWDPESDQLDSGSVMYLPEFSPGMLDLWNLRLGRSNPVHWADDQFVLTKAKGGRNGDDGFAPFELNREQSGEPKFVLDSVSTRGVYAFPFKGGLDSPYRHFMQPFTKNALGEAPLVTESMEYNLAINRGYTPQEGDVIPASRMREPTKSRSNISALGSHFDASVREGDNEVDARSDINSDHGTINAYFQRKLNTFQRDDIELKDGGRYNIAFAINTDSTGGRDHYVSFPMTLSLNGQPGDIEAIQMDGLRSGGILTRPDFTNTNQYPETKFNVVLPGITSYEFVTGQNLNKRYYKKNGDVSVKQVHQGSSGLNGVEALGCVDCHTVGANEVFKGTAYNAGSMANLVERRGGVYTPTPIIKR